MLPQYSATIKPTQTGFTALGKGPENAKSIPEAAISFNKKTGDRGKVAVEVLPQFLSGATAIQVRQRALMKARLVDGKAVVTDRSGRGSEECDP